MPNIEEISARVVDAGLQVHREFGPGLLESVYEAALARFLQDRGLSVVQQQMVPIQYRELRIEEGFRADLVVEGVLVIELKSVEQLAPVHYKQLQTYLRLMNLRIGLLLNFGAATFKEGIKRVVNDHHDVSGSRLRVNQSAPRLPIQPTLLPGPGKRIP